MPKYGASQYASGVNKCPVFSAGLRTVLFGTLVVQPPNWAGAQGSPLWPPAPEAVAAGDASQAVAFKRDEVHPNAVALEIAFSANPGVFQLDIQTSDTDANADFVTKGSFSAGLNASFVGRMEILDVAARFLRVKVVSLANAVSLLVVIS
jgi:hypothetical protein